MTERKGGVPRREVESDPYLVWRKRLNNVKGTGQLLRVSQGILMDWPAFREKAGGAAYFHRPWIYVGEFMVRFDHMGYNHESLRIDRMIDFKKDDGESIEIPYKGANLDEANLYENSFEELTYIRSAGMGVQPFKDPDTGETYYVGVGTNDLPFFGESALPKAKEILGAILDKMTEELRAKESSKKIKKAKKKAPRKK